MKDENKLIFILSIRFSLVMIILSFFLRLVFFEGVVSLLLTPLVVGAVWLLVSVVLLSLVKGSSEEIFALLIPKSSDNEMGNSSQSEEIVSDEKSVNKSEVHEVEYGDLFDSSKNATVIEEMASVEKENSLLKNPKKKSGEMSADDFKVNDPKDIARAVRSMLNKD